MQPELELITKEIPAKGKGYLILRKCWPDQVCEAVRQGASALLGEGATQIYAASTDPSAPLAGGRGEGYRLEFRHDMLRLERALDGKRPRPEGRLQLEELRREKWGAWLALYNETFFDVPNSATYRQSDLQQVLDDGCRCGFALLDGVPVGVYELALDGGTPEIEGVSLVKDCRGRGLGRELLLSVTELLAAMGHGRACLRVSTANAAAYALYRGLGFVQTDLISHWYEVISEGDLRA